MRYATLVGLLLILTGCTSQSSFTLTGRAVEMDDVPFFPQQRYQCGPAALATVLKHSGVTAAPDDLVPLVYVPARRGSFQPELKAAARQYGRLPYELPAEPRALFAEIEGGNPVLVMQNLRFDWWPKWHYAVLIGYDPAADTVILRSGTEARRIEPLGRFLHSWELAGRWATLTLRPGELPVTATADRYLRAIVDGETLLASTAVAVALEAGMRRWPDDPDLMFAAANQRRLAGDIPGAAALYHRVLERQPVQPAASNNYADLLLQESCLATASVVLQRAFDHADPGSPIYPVLEQTARELDEAVARRGRVDSGPHCAALTPAGGV